MAGIAGIAGRTDRAVLRAMLHRLRHRGPDGEGTYLGEQAMLAACQHEREATRNTGGSASRAIKRTKAKAGKKTASRSSKSRAGGPSGSLGQPFTDGAGDLRVVLDGELTNASELRAELTSAGAKFQTDAHAEVVLEAWRRYGTDCFSRMAGAFACGIWDQRIGTLALARDVFGVKPLHMQLVGESLRFGSEIKALTAAPDFVRELDPFAIEDFFTWGYIPPPRTIWRSVRALPPGHYALFREGRLSLHRYFALVWPGQAAVRSREDWLLEFFAAMERALGRVLDLPANGGRSATRLHLDGTSAASLLACVAGRVGGPPPTAVNMLAVPDPFDREEDELPGVGAIAHGLGVECQHADVNLFGGADGLQGSAHALLRHLDQPIADPTLLLRLASMKTLAGRGVHTLVDPLGASEVFGGHARVMALQRSERLDWAPPLLCDLGTRFADWIGRFDRSRTARWLTGTPRGMPTGSPPDDGFALVRHLMTTRLVSLWREVQRALAGTALSLRDRYLRGLQLFTAPACRGLFSPGFQQVCEAHDAAREYRVAFDRLARGTGSRQLARHADEPRVGWSELVGQPADWPNDWDTPGALAGAIDYPADAADGRPGADRAMALDLAAVLPGSVLPGLDACSALSGVEVRLPYLDRELVQWATALPTPLKVGPGGGQRIVRMALREAAPKTPRRPAPAGARRQLADWLLRPENLGITVDSVVTPEALTDRGVIRPATVRRMRRAHATGRANLSLEMVALWIFEQWCRVH